jgi:uncharacterized protein
MSAAEWENSSGHAHTPVMAERRLHWLDNEMTRAELALRKARDDEVAAKHEYEAARRRAGFDKDCPRVARGAATVDERKQWIDDQCAKEQRAYDLKVAAREAAQDHHRTVRDQAMIAMALLRSVSTAFNMSGVS